MRLGAFTVVTALGLPDDIEQLQPGFDRVQFGIGGALTFLILVLTTQQRIESRRDQRFDRVPLAVTIIVTAAQRLLGIGDKNRLHTGATCPATTAQSATGQIDQTPTNLERAQQTGYDAGTGG